MGRIRQSGGGGGAGAVQRPNTVYLSSGGNNATAIKGDRDFPFATFSAANAEMLRGDTMVCLDASFNMGATTLSMNDGCTYNFRQTSLTFTGSVAFSWPSGGSAEFLGANIALNSNTRWWFHTSATVRFTCDTISYVAGVSGFALSGHGTGYEDVTIQTLDISNRTNTAQFFQDLWSGKLKIGTFNCSSNITGQDFWYIGGNQNNNSLYVDIDNAQITGEIGTGINFVNFQEAFSNWSFGIFEFKFGTLRIGTLTGDLFEINRNNTGSGRNCQYRIHAEDAVITTGVGKVLNALNDKGTPTKMYLTGNWRHDGTPSAGLVKLAWGGGGGAAGTGGTQWYEVNGNFQVAGGYVVNLSPSGSDGTIVLKGQFRTTGAGQPTIQGGGATTGNARIIFWDAIAINDGTVAAVRATVAVTYYTIGAFQQNSALLDANVTFNRLYEYGLPAGGGLSGANEGLSVSGSVAQLGSAVAMTQNATVIGQAGIDFAVANFDTATLAATVSVLIQSALIEIFGNINLLQGSSIINDAGDPEGAVTATVGSIYLRSDGGAGTTLYVKESGAGNTGWIGK